MTMQNRLLAASRPIFNICSGLDLDGHEGRLPHVYHSAIGSRLRRQMGAAVGPTLAGRGGRRGVGGGSAALRCRRLPILDRGFLRGRQSRIVLGAVQEDQLIGSVQLALRTMHNALHRAEVQKLLALRLHRRYGIGQALMTAVEETARQEGRRLLVLGTRFGGDAERLYIGMGYQQVGIIPQFAHRSTGTLAATIIFVRNLSV
jgi:GNAT superfamily N-acetyltransferase